MRQVDTSKEELPITVATWKLGMGSLFNNADPQKVAEEILSICDSPTKEQILEKARDPEAELHKCFEWNDKIAAEKQRLSQAQNIIRCLVIKEPDEQADRKPAIRFFYKTDKRNGSGYKPTTFIFQDKDEHQKLLAIARDEVISYKKKWERLAEVEEIVEAISRTFG